VVQSHDLPSALALILSVGGKLASQAQVGEFLQFAARRQINVAETWVAQIAGRLTWAALPVVSPGRTLLLFAAPLQTPPAIIAASEVVARVCQLYGRAHVDLAQILLDPTDAIARKFYGAHGFTEMAELIYLNGNFPRAANPPQLRPGIRWLSYSAGSHKLFADTILRTYVQSLDCPSLNGMRNIEDVIIGHKSTGEFHPELWHLLCVGDRPQGVLLLSIVPNTDALELVYLGLVPDARGKGLGEILMQMAFGEVTRTGRVRITLAADSKNTPALKLYYRHGLTRIASKIAIMRDLRVSAAIKAGLP